MRARGFAALAALGLLLLAAPPAQADVVGPLDPEAAQLCGGSAHSPNCSGTVLAGACCGALGLAVGGIALALVGRRKPKQ